MKKKKLSSWKNITNFLYNHFSSGILASFETSTFSWLIFGQISLLAEANLPFSHEIRDFFQGNFQLLALIKLLPFLPHWPRNCRNPSMWSLPLECHFVPGTIFCPRFRGRSSRLHGTGLPRRWPAIFINPHTYEHARTHGIFPGDVETIPAAERSRKIRIFPVKPVSLDFSPQKTFKEFLSFSFFFLKIAPKNNIHKYFWPHWG